MRDKPFVPERQEGQEGCRERADNATVEVLAMNIKAKLTGLRAKGYRGWNNDCTHQRLSELLREFVDKGDPVDMANFCAFLLARSESIAPKAQADARDADGMYYLQNARWAAIVGNYPSFWRFGGGYTTSLDDAECFTLVIRNEAAQVPRNGSALTLLGVGKVAPTDSRLPIHAAQPGRSGSSQGRSAAGMSQKPMKITP